MSNPFRQPRVVKGAVRAPQIPVHEGVRLGQGVQRPVSEGAPGEGLTGQVQGQRATDLEERVNRAAEKHTGVRSVGFNPRLVAGQLLPANVNLSFAIYAPTLYPVQVDPAFPLNSGQERAEAQVNDDLLTEHLKTIGATAQPVVRLSRLELATQAQADAALKGML